MRRIAVPVMTAALLIGVGLALAALLATGGSREPEQARLLTVVLLAAPALLTAAWLVVRPQERPLAAGTGAALYFFTPFVAARIESLIDPVAAASVGTPHQIYFTAVLVLHLSAGLALIRWRAADRHSSPPDEQKGES
jgi:hypothetical protein